MSSQNNEVTPETKVPEETVTANVSRMQIVFRRVYKSGVQELPKRVYDDLIRRDAIAPMPIETVIEAPILTPVKRAKNAAKVTIVTEADLSNNASNS